MFYTRKNFCFSNLYTKARFYHLILLIKNTYLSVLFTMILTNGVDTHIMSFLRRYFFICERRSLMRIRREAKDNFTWVHNAFIYDKRLSLAERGLLLLLMSLPMNWKFSMAGIATMIADGRDKVSSTLKALELHGYSVHLQEEQWHLLLLPTL